MLGHAAELKHEDLFNPNRILEIAIDLPESDWKELCSQSRDFRSAFANPSAKPFSYFKGDIAINGVRVSSVGIRKKGFLGSLDENRPSLKIKFDEFIDQAPIAGMDRLTLNNNKQDNSLVSQFLTYSIFEKAGLKAPRCNYARVTVNGDTLGLYSHVESIRKPFLERAFGKGEGILYEGTLSDFYPKAIDRLELKKGNKDRAATKINRLAELLATDTALDLQEVEKLVDVDYFIRFWALESLIGFWDGYSNNQNNYFFYEHPDNGKFYFIPWGADGAFQGGMGMMRRMQNAENIAVYGESMLANRLYHTADIAERYRETMRDLLAKVWNEVTFFNEMDRIDDLLGDILPETQNSYLEANLNVRDFIQTRRAKMKAMLEDWPARIAETPRKPSYSIDRGSAVGSFETTWGNQANQNDSSGLEIVLDGQDVVLEGISVRAEEMPIRGFGGFGSKRNFTPPVRVSISGQRTSDGESVSLNLLVDPKKYQSTQGQTLDVNGSYRVGDTRGSSFFGGFGGGSLTLTGELLLEKNGLSEGAPVSGSFTLSIIEQKGGMFSRRR